MAKADEERTKRLAEALRENLRRRKAHGRTQPAKRVDGKDDTDS
jgi:hypothetical protein